MEVHPDRKAISRTKTTLNLRPPAPSAAKYAQGYEGKLSAEEHKILKEKEGWLFICFLILIQAFFIIIYGLWIRYPAQGDEQYWSMTRDVSIMIFFGFGFLMTFLRRYAYSAIGYTLLISSLVVQWSIPLQGFFNTIYHTNNDFGIKSPAGTYELLNGLFCAAAVMISYGAILGKVTPTQMLILGFLEPIFYWVNVYVTIIVLGVLDIGGGMTIHTFGAYYGLTICFFLTSSATRSHKDNTSAYSSDIFSLAGTLFLFICWPSFNAAAATTSLGQTRALVNTFLSISSSTIATFIVSRWVSDDKKFDVVHIQNSVLAGGVAMGVVADLVVSPYGAMICGFSAGVISVWGYKYLTPFLANKFNIQDVCGIHNLHGLPGIVSCIIGVFVTLASKDTIYNNQEYNWTHEDYASFPQGASQSGYQLAGLAITLGIAIGGGLITSLFMVRGWKFAGLVRADFFNDRYFWSFPSDYEYVIDKDEDLEEEGGRGIELVEKKETL